MKAPAFLSDPWSFADLWSEAFFNSAVATPASGTQVAVGNTAIYVPVRFPCNATLYNMSFCSTNSTGNYDLGLYNSDLALLASKGSTAMATTIETLTFSGAIEVKAGCLYYAALALSSTSGTIYRCGISLIGSITAGCGQQASALPLPSTASPVTVAVAVIPLFVFGVR